MPSQILVCQGSDDPHRVEYPKHSWCDDKSCNLSLSHLQNWYCHRSERNNEEPRVRTITHCMNRKSDGKGSNTQGSSWVGKSQGHVAPRCRRLRIRGLASPGSYLFRKLRAFYVGIRDAIIDSSMSAGKEVIAVEPYFAVPVMPVVTTTVAPHV